MQSDYARQYENLWLHHWWWQSRKQFVLQHLRRLNAARALGTILDIGCGNGLFFDDLAQFGAVQGIEPDPSLVHEGPHRDRIQIRLFDQTFVPDKPFDLVLMLDVLEHIEDHLAAARRVREILAPTGTFLLTVPALPSLWSRHDTANLHFRRYTRKTLRQVLTDAGFQIQTIRYFFGWTLAPMYLRRLVSPAADPNATAGSVQYQVQIPAKPINALMYAVSRLEQRLLGPCLPVGSSLLAVATPRP